jgi:hypothetical protein
MSNIPLGIPGLLRSSQICNCRLSSEAASAGLQANKWLPRY